MKKKSSQVKKVCPSCKFKFENAKKDYVPRFECDCRLCPNCLTPIFYHKEKGQTTVILYEDKFCVDNLVNIFQEMRTEETGFDFTLGKDTPRERKFGYELIEWARKFMNGAEYDIGYNVHEFLEQWVRWCYSKERDELWLRKTTSLCALRNHRERLAFAYYEAVARERGIITREHDRLKRTLEAAKLQFDAMGL